MNPWCGVRRRALARCAVLGRLLPAGSRLARHLARCEECRAAWHDLRHLTAELSRTLAMPALAEALADAAWVRITDGGVGPQPACLRRGGYPHGGRRPIALAATGVAGLALFGVWLGRTMWRGLPSGRPRVTRASLPGPGVAPGSLRRVPSWIGVLPEGSRRLKPRQERHEVRLRGLLEVPASRPQTAKMRGRAWSVPLPAQVGSVPLLSGRQTMGQRGDLDYLNEEPRPVLRHRDRAGESAGSSVYPAPWPGGDDFVTVPFPLIAAAGSAGDRSAADALAGYRREVAVVDARLARRVTLAVKATALSDLCERLRGDTGIQLLAGQSVADEKVTLFCKEMSLREIMRQLSRPFGYTWVRSGRSEEYRYELMQDLRSQLLEEELRNRERNEALIALDREIERYRPYLGLSPDEALARAKTGARGGLSREQPADKTLLQNLAGPGWGPLQIYFRLSRNDQAALRSGEKLKFSAEPKPGEQSLPADVARGVLQSLRDVRLLRYDDGFRISRGDTNEQGGLLPSAASEARAVVTLEVSQSELGQFTLAGNSGVFTHTPLPRNSGILTSDGPLATGTNTTALQPESEPARSRLAQDPSLRARVTIQPQPSCGVDLSPSPSPKRGGAPDAGYGIPRPEDPSSPRGGGVGDKLPLPASGRRDGGAASWPRSGQRAGRGGGRPADTTFVPGPGGRRRSRRLPLPGRDRRRRRRPSRDPVGRKLALPARCPLASSPSTR
jgi:hypothetical protein